MQLSQQLWSKTIAESISWKYTNMIQLCAEINNNENDILKDLMIATSGKPEKLGRRFQKILVPR